MVLKCIWTIELNWMEKYGKMAAKQKIWKKFKGLLGTGNTLFSCFDQVLYFDHKFLISYPICVIQLAN